MAHVVTSPCIGVHDTACHKACPVNCFFDVPLSQVGLEGPGNILLIHPKECVDCGLCITECPVSAIFAAEAVPAHDKKFIDINKKWFEGKDAAQLESFRISAGN